MLAADRSASQSELEEAWAHVARLERTVAQQDAREVVLASRLLAYEAQLVSRDSRLQALESELSLMRHSISWRVTRPLRSAPRSLRGSSVRRAMRFLYWVLTLQVMDRLRERRRTVIAINVTHDGTYRTIADSKLFDAVFYRATNPEIAVAGLDPLAHYIREGARQGRDPNPLFDATFYGETTRVENALLHYIESGAADRRNPNPYFDADLYADEFRAEMSDAVSPLAHFLARPEVERGLARMLKSESSEVRWTPHLKRLVQSTLCHTLERRAISKAAVTAERYKPGIVLLLESADCGERESFALAVARELARGRDVRLVVLLKRGGACTERFQAAAPSVVLDCQTTDSDEGTTAVNQLLAHLGRQGFESAVCFDSSSADIALLLSAHGVRVVSVIDEPPRVVHPNPFAQERGFARMQIAKALNLPESAWIVLGCGEAGAEAPVGELRDVADRVQALNPPTEVHFVLLTRNDGITRGWSLGERVQHVSDRVHVRACGDDRWLFYAGADAMLSLSAGRFPMACMEGMASGLPVVAFEDEPTRDLLGADAAVWVARNDRQAMAESLVGLIQEPESRSAIGAIGSQRIRDGYQLREYVEVLLQELSPATRVLETAETLVERMPVPATL